MILGLPDGVRACLFDLDGVLTDTASMHAAAWKQVFDDLLRSRDGDRYRPFDADGEYRRYVDGRRRRDGIRGFLASRGVELPEAEVAALAAAKDELVSAAVQRDGVRVYEGSVAYVRAAREAGLRCAVVSASRHCREVLRVSALEPLFELRVDGVTAGREHLRGKPAPDTFLYAARELGIPPAACAVFEDALSGVEAGRAGGFGVVVGVARGVGGDILRERGADVVVHDLAELLPRGG
jgi:beta-phosphoglucomutase family hydrolase